MKKILLILFFYSLHPYCYGQHAVEVRKTALAMLKACEEKNYNAYVNYFYPTELKWRGGRAKFINTLLSNDRLAPVPGLRPGKETFGKVSKIYRAGKELHCVIERTTRFYYFNKLSVNHSHFLAISGDNGKTWKFIMTGGKIPSEIWLMVPKFNEDLMWSDYSDD
jgi:hypothetical protein